MLSNLCHAVQNRKLLQRKKKPLDLFHAEEDQQESQKKDKGFNSYCPNRQKTFYRLMRRSWPAQNQ